MEPIRGHVTDMALQALFGLVASLQVLLADEEGGMGVGVRVEKQGLVLKA
jgi:hypothetical protein